ncbi:hypothetical protein RUM44_001894 [Polyplax serrata]|uniref:Phosphoacetylglucosamine mutase n=1 Tax=Polyplax serrata TaxID=468196 RepID=A0ABR1AM18_POLSC
MTSFVRYGTAGFRDRAENLETVMFRVGMLAVLRSKKKNGQTIGLMITASHNPEGDNGVKLIDPFGEMLEQSWEELATVLANCDSDNLDQVVNNIVQEKHIDLSCSASVFVGQDTRSSSPRLSEIGINGIKSLNGDFKSFGIVTTPFLHYMVFCKNALRLNEPSVKDYNEKLLHAFKELNTCNNKTNGTYKAQVVLDGANGVGGLKVNELRDDLVDLLNIRIYNNGSGILNHRCGADFVKVQKKPPEGVPIEPNVRCLSFDGDADRLIYYYIDEENKFHLLDGDRIAILIASYIIELIRSSNLDITLGIVQTAYANGSSTDYISKVLKIPVAFSPTGVKHLHHKALEYDIGVYFEANGHGSVLFSETAEEKINFKAASLTASNEEKKAAARLNSLIKLTNQTVGDALSDALLVETVLKARDWDLREWEATYTDLPNRLLKVAVKDNTVIKTDYTEQVCLNPPALQTRINEIVSKVERGRSFIRPSGTEKVVRIYAEAATQEAADNLALNVASAVYELADGVGDLPTI